MVISRGVGAGLALVALLSCAAMPAWADRGDRDKDRREDARHNQDRRQDAHKEVRRDDARYLKKGYVHDNRYRHDRYYPPRGHVIQKLPPQHHAVPFRGTRYYYHDGAWYQPSHSRYVVVAPPVGLRISFLPSFYTTIWVGALPYYYADSVYYTWHPEERVYVVSDPPPETEVSEQPSTPDQLFVYPQKGQGEQQQATDRYQCHSWSVGQTSFDPTQPGGNVPMESYDSKRSDYQRAMKACLEARGYSVQ